MDRHNDTLIIPKTALLYKDGQPVVFVVQKPPKEEPSQKKDKKSDAQEKAIKADFIAKQRNVTLGYSDQKYIEIVKGLTLGEKIVTAGNTHLSADTPIRLDKPAAKKPDQSTEPNTPKPSEETAK